LCGISAIGGVNIDAKRQSENDGRLNETCFTYFRYHLWKCHMPLRSVDVIDNVEMGLIICLLIIGANLLLVVYPAPIAKFSSHIVKNMGVPEVMVGKTEAGLRTTMRVSGVVNIVVLISLMYFFRNKIF
jgi:hypothetical protein